MKVVNKTASKLPREEWDFRQVDDSALRFAALYEYARTSDKLRKSICEWLDTDIQGHRVREHIHAHLLLEENGKKVPWWKDSVWEKVEWEIFDAGRKATGNFELFEIIETRPDFPAPWMAFPHTYGKNPDFSRLMVTPISWDFRRVMEQAKKSGDAMRELALWHEIYDCESGPYCLHIDWGGYYGEGVTEEELITDFARWLRKEAKKHKLRRGKASQRPVDPLRWLAAYRLSKAGVTFPESERLLESEKDYYNHLPKYRDKSSWSDAIRRAKAFLKDIESGRW